MKFPSIKDSLSSKISFWVNPVLSSCSIAFEPDFYRSKGLFYSIFSYRSEDNIIEWEQMPWYAQTKKYDRPGWTEPYDDAAASDDLTMLCVKIKA